MWILAGNERSPDVTHYLLCNRDILVGRRTDIRLEDDKSISRTHACLRVTYLPEDVLSLASRGRVTLSDRSKYGTCVNGQRLEGQTEATVTDGARITFGLQWNTWTLSWRPLSVVASLLSVPDRDALRATLAELGGTQLGEWDPAVSLLVMGSFKMSVKAVLALASGTPVVTPQYLHEMAVCLRAGMAPDSVSAADFQPAIDEPTLAGSGCSIAVDRTRSSLFFGRRFVFAEEPQLQRMRWAVELAGGTALLLSDCGLSQSELTGADVVVMDTELKSPEINKLRAVLKRARRRLVRDQEIGLAILRASTERDCNPAFDYRTAFVPPLVATQSQSLMGPVLARETQQDEPPAGGAPTPTPSRQADRVVPPTPATPSTAPSRAAPSAGPAPSIPTGAPPTPATPSTAPSRPAPSAGPAPPTPSWAEGGANRPADPDWPAGSEGKRPRREATVSPAASTAAGPPPPSLELLGGPPTTTANTSRRSRQSPAEEPQPAFKRPRLSGTGGSRPARPAADDDLFDFDLEETSRPTARVKREPSPIPETPASREPALKREPEPESEVERKPALDGTEEPGEWISSCRQSRPPDATQQPEPKRQQSESKREQVSVSGDGDTSALVRSCIRLQVSELLFPRRPPPDATATADTSVTGANFKRFRRVRQPPVCPRVIGGSDLFVGHGRRPLQALNGNCTVNGTVNGAGNGHGRPASDEEDDLRPEREPGRWEADDDDDLMRMLDGVGRDRSGRSRRR